MRDVALLESAVGRPQATFGGKELYADVHAKAGAMMESIIGNHPFLDGNKRTGIAAAGLFLPRNGWRLTASNTELERFTMQVANGVAGVDEIIQWLRGHSSMIG